MPQRALIACIALAVACSEPELTATCESLGLCEAAPPDPEGFLLVADGSPGSSASLASVEPVLAAILERAADRPGSIIRVWSVGTGTDSREIASVEVLEPARRVRNRRAHRTSTIATLRATLLPRIAQALESAAGQRRSAIAETITLAARSSPHMTRRWLVVVSDLREHMPPFSDLECPRELPTSARFARNLERRGLLGPGTLDGFEVVLVDLGLPPFPNRRQRRCNLSVRRSDELHGLWSEAVTRAGARRVIVAHGALVFDDAPAEAGAEEGASR